MHLPQHPLLPALRAWEAPQREGLWQSNVVGVIATFTKYGLLAAFLPVGEVRYVGVSHRINTRLTDLPD